MVFNLYSKRQKELRGEKSDIYIYDDIPRNFRVQVVHLWHKSIGIAGESDNVDSVYQFITKALREEYGVFHLASTTHRETEYHELRDFFLNEPTAERVLDVIEFSFNALWVFGRRFDYRRKPNPQKIVDDAIADLNIRFKENSLGFQFVDGKILRTDSELIHEEVVKPLLHLLSQPEFKGAEDEYLKAHEHYRHGNAKEALNECLKAFESAMMSICQKRGWAYDPKATAKTLIGICLANHLIPSFWESEMTGLRALLEGGVPTGRNKLAGHGQGAEPVSVPPHIVSYIMHMTAANLKFLAEADAALG